MRAFKTKKEQSAQERQDEIFRKMPAGKKIELWAAFWKLAKDLVGDKINYGANRSAAAAHPDRSNS